MASKPANPEWIEFTVFVMTYKKKFPNASPLAYVAMSGSRTLIRSPLVQGRQKLFDGKWLSDSMIETM